MKKVLLVNANTEKMPYPVAPLGLCLLASQLENKYTVKIYDGVFDEGLHLTDEILAFKPDYIGVSIRNIDNMYLESPSDYTVILMQKFILPIEQCSPDTPLILGGSGFSIYPQELMQLTRADYGISGEGEFALPALLQCLDERSEVSGIPGIYSKNGTVGSHLAICYPFSLKNLLFSKIDKHIDFEPYRQRGAYPIQSKRGCYHNCIYCAYPVIEGRNYRLRLPEEIVNEIEEVIQRLGTLTFEFVDSTFNDPPGHAEAICYEIIKRNIGAKFRTMGINPMHTSSELFHLMKEAGFTQIDCTPDSASPTMIQKLQKNFTLVHLKQIARLIREADLPTMWFFLLGGPGENETTVEETFSFIDRWIYPLDLVHFTVGLRIYPQTPLYTIAVQEGKIKEGDSLFAPEFYLSSELGKEKLYRLVNEAAAKRPNCIPAWESNPTPEMVKEAFALQQKESYREPLFRTLLRIRYRNFKMEIPKQ
ncbi:MAG: radical SAM protein [Lentimicrobiaceae bacterium]|nr:radical SAM protein [Lentimicrobiaceae bacterium]